MLARCVGIHALLLDIFGIETEDLGFTCIEPDDRMIERPCSLPWLMGVNGPRVDGVAAQPV
jgi:hypothetical protein